MPVPHCHEKGRREPAFSPRARRQSFFGFDVELELALELPSPLAELPVAPPAEPLELALPDVPDALCDPDPEELPAPPDDVDPREL
jgi:hypothetical protein